MENDNNKCAHTLCMCPKAPNSDYCSGYCENANDVDTTGIACDCGHADCE